LTTAIFHSGSLPPSAARLAIAASALALAGKGGRGSCRVVNAALVESLRVALAKVGMMTPTSTVRRTTLPPRIQCSRRGTAATLRMNVQVWLRSERLNSGVSAGRRRESWLAMRFACWGGGFVSLTIAFRVLAA
jgi:hypothetical protein